MYKSIQSLNTGDIVVRGYDYCKIENITTDGHSGQLYHFKGFIVPDYLMRKIFTSDEGKIKTSNLIAR